LGGALYKEVEASVIGQSDKPTSLAEHGHQLQTQRLPFITC